MKHLIHTITLICLITCAEHSASAQQFLQYWGRPDVMLQEQASIALEQSYKILEKYPPTTQAGDERKLALFALDLLLHDVRLDNTPAFSAYINRTAKQILAKLRDQKPTDGQTRFYQCYNHGFIVQTSTVTIAIDLVRGGRNEASMISDSLMQHIVQHCDILFVSHAHGDHADLSVAKMFWEQGKQVVVPPGLWSDLSPNIITLRGEKQISQAIPLKPSDAPLQVSVYSGRQSNMLNNLYVITLPNGHTIMHTGDQDNQGDLALIAGIKEEIKIDILLAHCWLRPTHEIIQSINPALVITGHQNEMAHTIDHREAFWMTFLRMENVGAPYVVMAWGESYSYGR